MFDRKGLEDDTLEVGEEEIKEGKGPRRGRAILGKSITLRTRMEVKAKVEMERNET